MSRNENLTDQIGINFSLISLSNLLFFSFFAGPPGKLAEALMFTSELKSSFQDKGKCSLSSGDISFNILFS